MNLIVNKLHVGLVYTLRVRGMVRGLGIDLNNLM